MGTDSEKSKHNPDGDNLKSLLKKTGIRRDNKKPNRVVFNETKNEFFDADYIILIREECEFDDEDDESVCTCYQHEMVRLTCCEPDCSCGGSGYADEFEPTPPSPKFAPPVEFVDAVTLSPPEGYKDMELEEREMLAYKQMARSRSQRMAVCKECSASQEHEDGRDDNCELNSDTYKPKIDLEDEEKEKNDQSQQTTPTSPINSDGQSYLLDSPHAEEKSSEDSPNPSNAPPEGSPVSGILKGGKLWRQSSKENNPQKPNEQLTKTDSTSDDDSSTTRTVRFIEEEKKDSCKSSPESDRQIEGTETPTGEHLEQAVSPDENVESCSPAIEPTTEMMLTFKLGNHVLISNNSLKPNSAVRQLFPCTKPPPQQQQQQQHLRNGEEEQQYLVTAESLRAFEEAKRSKLPQMVQNATNTDSIKRVIERNTLRRSLVRYEPKTRKTVQKTDNSLVERIKQLTCDIDEDSQDGGELSARVSPTGEEVSSSNVDASQLQVTAKSKERNFSPSSSSTSSSNSSSMSSTYRKLTDLFGKRDNKPLDVPSPSSTVTYEPKAVQTQTLPDLGGPYHQEPQLRPITEPRKQFLSTLACVGNVGHHPDEHYYHLSNQGSLASSTGSEYTLEDIDEALIGEETKKITPDVLAGTPASESGDELVKFVQQDATRMERLKKKYDAGAKKEEDDEHDDYGFNRRPSVRGIKPRFGSTTEILQQIQNQIQQPTTNTSWPYYSESGLSRGEEVNTKPNGSTQQHLQTLPKTGYRPVTLLQDNQYQNCGYREMYKSQSSLVGVEVDCPAVAKRNGRPISPPPLEMSRNFHQTMVYIPYNHIDSYQQPQPVANNTYYDYYRYNQNQINKKFIEPGVYQKVVHHVDEQQQQQQYCNAKVVGKYANNYQPLLAPSSRSESPLMGNFAMARSTQTSMGCLSSCTYYQTPGTILRYREPVQVPYKPDYTNKINRHSFPSVRPVSMRYNNVQENSEHLYMEEADVAPHNGQILNGYYNYLPHKESPGSSPTKARFIERGVPEGAASISPQDSINLQTNSSTNTSPTLPHSNAKPLFYAMNV